MAKKTRQFEPITQDERAALSDYAAARGPRWKSALNIEWMRATASPTLHRLRNTHGPSWLASYVLPTEAVRS